MNKNRTTAQWLTDWGKWEKHKRDFTSHLQLLSFDGSGVIPTLTDDEWAWVHLRMAHIKRVKPHYYYILFMVNAKQYSMREVVDQYKEDGFIYSRIKVSEMYECAAGYCEAVFEFDAGQWLPAVV